MAKTYYNNAIIGNSSMLGCLSSSGELVRLFWPNIDYPQHVESFKVGIFVEGCCGTMWLDGGSWQHKQEYMGHSNIVTTVYWGNETGLVVKQHDFVLTGSDVLVRSYNIENRAEKPLNIGFTAYSSCISTNTAPTGTLFDFINDSLIHYRHGYYFSVKGDRKPSGFQIGDGAYESASCAFLKCSDSVGMSSDGALTWKLGCICPGERLGFSLHICAAHTLKDVKKLIKAVGESDAEEELEATAKYWNCYLDLAPKPVSGNEEIDTLYKRSLLVFKLMSDKNTGGLLAAPELDENFSRCGRYAYCWGRDAAFITGALDRCGMHCEVDRFYDWAAAIQDEDGSWGQRYHMDGSLGPSWGIQVDETGTLVWGMLEHYKITRDKNFLKKMWPSVKRAVEFLTGFLDDETGLPGPSFDLWEERHGEHAYSSAAVYGGIKAGAEIAALLDMDSELTLEWQRTAAGIKEKIIDNFWKENYNRFIRSVRVKLNPWGSEPTPDTLWVKVNSYGHARKVTREDWKVDVSLIGLAIPFGVFDVSHPGIRSTVELIEKVLGNSPAGGIKRYEDDGYIGGNPWILAALWVALYYCKAGDYDRAKEYFKWAVSGRTELFLLPEQVDRDSGKPAWVIPLTWSHAMFVLVFFELVTAGVF